MTEARDRSDRSVNVQGVMEIADLLSPNSVAAHLKAANKKQVLQEIADRAGALTGIPALRILETLMERERLGSTGMGQGIAIPHGRIAGISKMTGFFAQLDRPVDFDAMDDQPVDLVFLLLAPVGAGADHLKALARVSRLLRNHAVCEKLRAAADSSALYSLLTEPTAASQAA
jgi:PTS system nitrogen regulatory IIA component